MTKSSGAGGALAGTGASIELPLTFGLLLLGSGLGLLLLVSATGRTGRQH